MILEGFFLKPQTDKPQNRPIFGEVGNPGWFSRLGLAGAAVLLTVPALVPYHAEPLKAFYQDWLAIVFGLIAAIPLSLALSPQAGRGEPVTNHQSPITVSLPWMALGLFGLAGVLALQVVLGRVTFVETSVTGILYITWAGLMVMVGARLRETFGLERTAFVLQFAFAAGGFLLALTGFMQLYRIEPFGLAITAQQVQMMVGSTGQQNYFTNIVACGLASLLALAAAGKIRMPIAALAGAPMILALAISGSRSAWMFLAIMVAVPLFLALSPRAERGEMPRLFAISAQAALLAYAASWAVSSGALPGPEGTVTTGVARVMATIAGTEVESVRKTLGLYAWHMWLANPLLGAGWGEYAWNAFTLAPDLGVVTPAPLDRHSHNLISQLLAETGLVGAWFVLAPLLLWFRDSWFALRDRRGAPRMNVPLSLALSPQAGRGNISEVWIVTVVMIHVVQAMVELPHWYAYLLGPFALVLGLGARDAVRVCFAGWARFAPRVLLVAAIAVAAVRIADYRAFELWTREAVATQRAGRPLPPELLARLEKLDLSIFAPEVELIAGQLQFSGDLAARLELNSRAIHSFPLPELATQRVALLRLAGREDEAQAVRRSLAAISSHPLPDLP